jgi:hypothetical protein
MAAYVKIVTPPVRITFVNLFEPHAFDAESESKYSLTMLIPKDSPCADTITAGLEEVFNREKSRCFPGIQNLASNKLKLPLLDGDEYLETHPKRTEFAECWYMKATSKMKPPVYHMNQQLITDPREIYSGCWARVSFSLTAYNRINKGFSGYLNAVMKVADDEILFQEFNALDDFNDGFDYSEFNYLLG